MATSYKDYVGDGTTTDFSLTFGYLSQDHISVLVDGSPVTFTWFNSTTVRTDAAPAAAAAVRVKRTTSPTPIVDFVDGAVLFETDLDTSALQAIYIAEEATDAVGNSEADADAAAASAAAALVSETNAAASEAAAAASAALAATFDPTSYYTKVAQDVTDDAQDAAIALKADIASPTFTGVPAAPTAAPATNTTQIATTAFVATEIAAISSGGVDIQTFTSGGTWTKPAGAQRVYVQAWGAGGSGARRDTSPSGGSGGGGGEYRDYMFNASALGATETVTIGTGGVSITAGAVVSGNDGGNTTFGSFLTAVGGAGGVGSGAGGASGATQAGYGADQRNSGAGGVSNTSDPGQGCIYGGGGGGGAQAGAGSGGAGGVSAYGGNGGLGGGQGVNGVAGSQPGGGGGGTRDANSGAGGDGQVIVTSFLG